ncbi:MAG: hypothetical protein RJA92_1661 [Bacteroidota bacterium]|jgi:hypothetical protein
MVKSLIFKICSIIFLLILLDACKKTEQKSLLETRKSYLVGYGSFSTNWKLMTFKLDSIPQTLTNSQLLFVKQYLANGKFSDTDGAIGNWTIPIADSLHEIYTNYPSGVQVKQSYFIQFLSYDSLSLTYLLNGKKVNASFKAIR